MKDKDQMATEAWDKICDLTSKGTGKTEDFIAIIQSAIESERGLGQWTVETVETIWKDSGGWILTSNPYRAIADAHNATLQPAHASEQDTKRLELIEPTPDK